jgi:pSer/pThr/pTyr-binding forkhead associated (FHA) protein
MLGIKINYNQLSPVVCNSIDCSLDSSIKKPSWCIQPQKEFILEEIGYNNRVFDLSKKEFYIVGRNEKSDIVIGNLLVSRQHAAIIHHENGTPYLVDLDSIHGTFIGHDRLLPLVPVAISKGQFIRFGTDIQFLIRNFPKIDFIKEQITISNDIDASTLSFAEKSVKLNTLLNQRITLNFKRDDDNCNQQITSPLIDNDNTITPSTDLISNNINEQNDTDKAAILFREHISRSETLDFGDISSIAGKFYNNFSNLDNNYDISNNRINTNNQKDLAASISGSRLREDDIFNENNNHTTVSNDNLYSNIEEKIVPLYSPKKQRVRFFPTIEKESSSNSLEDHDDYISF